MTGLVSATPLASAAQRSKLLHAEAYMSIFCIVVRTTRLTVANTAAPEISTQLSSSSTDLDEVRQSLAARLASSDVVMQPISIPGVPDGKSLLSEAAGLPYHAVFVVGRVLHWHWSCCSPAELMPACRGCVFLVHASWVDVALLQLYSCSSVQRQSIYQQAAGHARAVVSESVAKLRQ